MSECLNIAKKCDNMIGLMFIVIMLIAVGFLGNRGEQWNKLVKLFRPRVGENFKLYISATRGASYKSDIAVDDITVTEGLCQQNSGKS